MKLIIAGGRNYQMTAMDLEALDELHRRHKITEVVSGCAPGADKGGETWAISRKLFIRHFPADWDRYGKGAGVIRNEDMAEYADAVMLFPGGNGTADMRRRAKRHGLKIFEKLAP